METTIMQANQKRDTSRWGAIGMILTCLLILLGMAIPASSQTATVIPLPIFSAFDSNGDPIASGKLCSYVSGTTTPLGTYADASLTPNTNPVIMDTAGRARVFLLPGSSYKFVLLMPGTDTTCSTGATVWTVDGVQAVPTSSSSVDFLCTAGETITAGLAVYLSDGSGGKTAGACYKADTANAYSSSTAGIVGLAPTAIASLSVGTVRLAGSVPGLSALSVGTRYYVSTSGALTSTIPTFQRFVGQADTTTSLIVAANPSVQFQPWADDFRLTLTTAMCETVTDVTAATTLFLTPCTGNRIDVQDSAGNPVRLTSTELSIAIPATTSQIYDVFVFSSSGTPTLELLAWTNDTTRATAIVRSNGLWVKTADTTRRYLGNMRTTTVSGQTEDSEAKRYIWNAYNRRPRKVAKFESGTWNYTTATLRQAAGVATNQVDVVVGLAEAILDITLQVYAANSGGGGTPSVIAIGEDSTTTGATGVLGAGHLAHVTAAVYYALGPIRLVKKPAIGRHVYTHLEWSAAAGTTTWQADDPNGVSGAHSGIIGWIEG